MTPTVDPVTIHDEIFVMDGLSAANFTEEYTTETLPNAGFNAVQKTVAGSGDDMEEAIQAIRNLQGKIEAWDNVHIARTVDEIERESGLSVVLGLQDSTPLERYPENVGLFQQLGVRIIQLTYNSRNLSGNGCTERVDGGISKFGLEVIESIEANNVLLDLSHAGPNTAKDALNAASQPTIFSHSNPKAVQEHPRNISDELIKAAVETGGVIGVNAYPEFVDQDPTIEDVVDHIEYLSTLVGSGNVSLGLDFIDKRSQEELEMLIDNPEYSDPPWTYPEGLESATKVPNLTIKLVERGFTEADIRGIMGENLLRVYKSVLD